jgi:hypothetical protein
LVVNGESDYIGTWFNGNDGESPFFLEILERPDEGDRSHVRGTIDDVYDLATFDGHITPDAVSFDKRYAEPTGGALTSAIHYEGKRRGAAYEGKWSSSGIEFRPDQRFILEECPPLETLTRMMARIRQGHRVAIGGATPRNAHLLRR